MARKNKSNPFGDLAESLKQRGVDMEDRLNSLGTGYEKKSLKSIAYFLAAGVFLLGIAYIVNFLLKAGII
jgi:hypothetical protein